MRLSGRIQMACYSWRSTDKTRHAKRPSQDGGVSRILVSSSEIVDSEVATLKSPISPFLAPAAFQACHACADPGLAPGPSKPPAMQTWDMSTSVTPEFQSRYYALAPVAKLDANYRELGSRMDGHFNSF